MIHILLFYKFVPIENLEEFKMEHWKFCKDLGVLGKILIAKEGINGSISGTKEQVESYKEKLTSDSRFNDIVFKEETGLTHPFTRMIVRIRNEIVALKKEVDLSKTGDYISPRELYELYQNSVVGKDFVIIDGRNSYEYKVGRFKGAIDPGTRTFRQFPEKVKDLKKFKDKKIIMYCTGGIRCEKATAVLREEGFENVYQLKDGIINFCQQFPNTFWEGSCFVFDKRLVSSVGQEESLISECEVCGVSCDLYKNCRSVSCDRLVILCVNCQRNLNGCCSEKCLEEFRNECIEKSFRKQNRRILVSR